MYETEVKLRTDDLEGVRHRLRELGARLKERVEDETDLLWRSVTDPEALKKQVLRLRLVGENGAGMLTWKGAPEFERGVKKREERQTFVKDASAMREILTRLGYEVSLEFSKSREYWDLRGLTISLDELPFGSYVEVEGEASQIERAVSDLGLEGAERVEEGYPQLAARWLGK
ncbi:MAG: class IV adenylate cyclase [Chloroflexota bacterium]|nr:class IV adenylate cyclase [Chloroflexota bacterium]